MLTVALGGCGSSSDDQAASSIADSILKGAKQTGSNLVSVK